MIFALFGEVPRVDDHHRAEMISAGRDRASVVLDFVAGGERYRVARALRRGGTQNVRLERWDAAGGAHSLADQVRTANQQVAEIVGLSAAAFMQAVVLPQGQFARFLQSQPRERRNILRSLLRLDVYERMRDQATTTAGERRSAVDAHRRLLAEEYEGVDEAALAELEARLGSTVAELAEVRQRREEAQEVLGLLERQHGKTFELRQAEARRQELLGRSNEIEAARERLAAAERAAPLLSFLDEAFRAGEAAAAAQREADQAESELQSTAEESEADSAALAAATQGAETIPRLRDQVARLHQVAGRLPEAARLEATIARQTGDIESLCVELTSLESQVGAARATREEQQLALDAARWELEQTSYDDALDALLEPLRRSAGELSAGRRRAAQAEDELETRREELAQLRARSELLEVDALATDEGVEAALVEAQRAREALHGAHQLDAANYLRGALVPDEPCPVCGQLVTSPPTPTHDPDVEAAKQALESANERQREAESTARAAREALTRQQAQVAAAGDELAEREDANNRLQAEVAEQDAGMRTLLGSRVPAADVVIEAWVESQAASLAVKRRAWEQAKERSSKAQRELQLAESNETQARERIRDCQTRGRRLADDHHVSQERLAALRQEIAVVTTSNDPAEEADSLTKRIDRLETDRTMAARTAGESQSRLMAAKERHRLKSEAAENRAVEAAGRGRQRDEEIARAGFADQSVVRAALLDPGMRAELSRRISDHERDDHTAAERIAALVNELGDVRVSDQELAAASKRADELAAALEAQLGNERSLEQQRDGMQKRLERARALHEQLAVAEQALRVYNQLASDLRSDKFQAYLLEEAFTELVQGASTRLLVLTAERYSLEFADDDIRVVDHDNAGETRISDTLSGGETFLTSLALALELSEQVQRAAGAVKLDCLFIDEGFGTLDPETLAVVSETIQGLRAGGRMVGIITHIPELRDEFAQQILVTKHQGFSTVAVRGVVETG